MHCRAYQHVDEGGNQLRFYERQTAQSHIQCSGPALWDECEWVGGVFLCQWILTHLSVRPSLDNYSILTETHSIWQTHKWWVKRDENAGKNPTSNPVSSRIIRLIEWTTVSESERQCSVCPWGHSPLLSMKEVQTAVSVHQPCSIQ